MFDLLVINPNSSQKVTNDMKNNLPEISGVNFHFYTAPSNAPKEISGIETSIKSEQIVLPDIVKLLNYDGYLVCCYSDHPLVYSLVQYTDKPIMGIMHGSLIYAILNPTLNLMIITSTSSWNDILDAGIKKIFGSTEIPRNMRNTRSFDISVVSLNNSAVYDELVEKVRDYLLQEVGVNCVLLGCAGMVGLDTKLEKSFPGVKFVDSVKVSAELLASLVRYNTSKH